MASGKINLIETPDAFAAAFTVSRETIGRLTTYEAMLKRWQKTINLVAPSTINHIWHRHFADSAQLWSVRRMVQSLPAPRGEGLGVGGVPDSPHPGLPPEGGGEVGASTQGGGEIVHWLDLGSGAGFPGLVIAILAAERGGTTHTLIESDSRKAAFLREVARETGVAVDILCARIEIPETRARVREVNCVTARALAPLPRLAELAYPYFGSSTVGIFAKGREVSSEIEETARSWDFTHELFPSVTDAEGRVLLLKSLSLKR